MIFLVSLVALLLGVWIGTLLRGRYIRQGVIDDLDPKLSRMQGQLNTIEAELAYMVSARYAELNARPLPEPRHYGNRLPLDRCGRGSYEGRRARTPGGGRECSATDGADDWTVHRQGAGRGMLQGLRS